MTKDELRKIEKARDLLNEVFPTPAPTALSVLPFPQQVSKFSQLVAPNERLAKHAELTGPEIEEMRERMDHKGEPARDEAAAINASEAAAHDTCPYCGSKPVRGYSAPGQPIFVTCENGHEWQATR
jgi:hypothetical protein